MSKVGCSASCIKEHKSSSEVKLGTREEAPLERMELVGTESPTEDWGPAVLAADLSLITSGTSAML